MKKLLLGLAFAGLAFPAAAALKAGDTAPDFTIKKLADHVPVSLASLWAQRPVVLVFGSYT